MKKLLCTIPLMLAILPIANATVTTQTLSASFSCSGSVGPYPFLFPINDPTALTVTENGAVLASTAWTSTPVNNNYANGGSVTLTAACPSGQSLVLARNTPLTQATSFSDNMPVPLKSFERSLDKLTEITQEQAVSVNGSIVTAPNFNGTMPAADANYINGTWRCTGSACSVEVPVNGNALPLTGGTLTGALTDASGFIGPLTGHASSDLPLTGGTLTGALTGTSASFSGSVSLPNGQLTSNTLVTGQITDNAYVNAGWISNTAQGTFQSSTQIPASAINGLSGYYLPLTGGTLSGTLSGTNFTATGSFSAPTLTITGTPTNTTDATTKSYVDNGLAAKASSTASTTVNGQTCELGYTCTAGSFGHAIVLSDMGNVAYTASQVVNIFYSPVAGTIPTSGTATYNSATFTSYCNLMTAATASTTFTFADNGTSFGTVNFAASGTSGTFTISSPKSVSSGDKITVTAPASADSTAAGLNCSLTFASY
jgi:hypothetical protein